MPIVQQCEKIKPKRLFGAVLYGLLLSLLFSMVAVFLVTILVFFTQLTLTAEELSMSFSIIMLISIFMAGLCIAYRIEEHGLVIGLLIGGLYALLAIQLGGFIIPEVNSMLFVLGKTCICSLAGALGGIIGVNL